MIIFIIISMSENLNPSKSVAESGDINEMKKEKIAKEKVEVKSVKAKSKSSMISNQEKEIIDKIKEKRTKNQQNALKKLIWVSIICIIFLCIEFVGSIYSKSTFLLSDALHLFSDFHGFAVSMLAIYLSSKPPNERYSYGFYRIEVLGAVISIFSIWGITAWVVYEAINKIVENKYDIEGNLFLIIAIIGLGCNLLMAHVLHSSGGHVS